MGNLGTLYTFDVGTLETKQPNPQVVLGASAHVDWPAVGLVALEDLSGLASFVPF